MRDGIHLAQRAVPVVALVTDDFRAQGNFVARASGMPDVPRVLLPHPVAGTGDEAMRLAAAEIAPLVVASLEGELRGEITRDRAASAAVSA